MSKFLSSLQEKALLGDGALGTMLTQAGLPPGESPELWMLAHPEKLKIIHQAYLKAGAQVIQTNTFGANRLKLQEYQASSQVQAINLTAARLVRGSREKSFYFRIVDLPVIFPLPRGIHWGQLVEVFREQMEALQKEEQILFSRNFF